MTVEGTAGCAAVVFVEAISLAAVGGWQVKLEDLLALGTESRGVGTYLAELVAAFEGDGHAVAVFAKLGEKVHSRGLAVDTTVGSVALGCTVLGLIFADGFCGNTRCGGSGVEVRRRDGDHGGVDDAWLSGRGLD